MHNLERNILSLLLIQKKRCVGACHDHCVPQLAVGDRWCFHVFLFCILHFETAFSARTSIFSPHHFVVLRRDFILEPRCARAILKNSNLHILHHTYSVTDKNNIQDFLLEFSCVISRPLHRVSRDRGFFYLYFIPR